MVLKNGAVASERLLGILCLLVLCITLSLGLWPFHSPENDVTWLGSHNGLRFGRFSTVISSAVFWTASPGDTGSGSMEVWLQPTHIWQTGTLFAIHCAERHYLFSMRQVLTNLVLRSDVQRRAAGFAVPEVFRRKGPLFLTVTSSQRGTSVYIGGTPTRNMQLSPVDLAGRLILGDAPQEEDSWSGTLLGLAIYRQELTAAQVLQHYRTWTQRGRPEIAAVERCAALYLFDERAGSVAHSRIQPGVDLQIPTRYLVLDKKVLEPFWEEFSMSRSYWSAALKNIVGFLPLGFVFYAWLSQRIRRDAVVTVLSGTLVSLIIEVCQAFLPTRDSGTTDLITNTLGTYLGVLLYQAISPRMGTRFPWLSFLLAPRGAREKCSA
jgi:VanZ like family/Concanavalin A-like lectin/glucanases superfamily